MVHARQGRTGHFWLSSFNVTSLVPGHTDYKKRVARFLSLAEKRGGGIEQLPSFQDARDIWLS